MQPSALTQRSDLFTVQPRIHLSLAGSRLSESAVAACLGGHLVLNSDAPRILISRMSAMGDTILTLPVACALRERFPNAYLGWVVERRASMVVQEHECLDAVIVLDRGWFTSPSAMYQARQELRPHGFEVAIDCQSMTKSALACWLSGAKLRVGCRGKYGCELSPYLNNHLVEPVAPHLVDRTLELLGPLGIESPEVNWKYPIDAASEAQAADLLASLDLQQEFAVMNPGATWDSRRWEMDRFGAVANYLAQQHGLPTLVVWGSQREREWAREIVAHANGNASLAPDTQLATLAAVLKRSRIFLSADTGPMHLAVAVGAPSISLHGVTRPADSGPYGSPHCSIQVRHDPMSRRQRKRTDNSAMRLITPELVNRHCDSLLAATEASVRDAA